MADPKPSKGLSKLKTSSTQRRLSLAKASMTVGGRWASNAAGGLFKSKEDKQERNDKFILEQAEYLVKEIGELKGSLVKIGQMAALYGDHFFPPEVSEALHKLDNQTNPIDFSELWPFIKSELGPAYKDFEVDEMPIGTASLAQVHKARIKSTGEEVVLKVQYPGVAEAVDSDLAVFKGLLKMTNLLPQTKAFDEWFNELANMMHQEVNYLTEADSTRRFAGYVEGDPRYAVPKIYTRYSSEKLMVMSYEPGVSIKAPSVKALSQDRRDRLGEGLLEIMFQELFVWGEMQTDPNFGNYLIRISEADDQPDQIVMLDFGAIRAFDADLLKVAQNLIMAGYARDHDQMIAAMSDLPFFDDMPDEVKTNMAGLFLTATEPFAKLSAYPELDGDVVEEGSRYRWSTSKLHSRLSDSSRAAVVSKYFSVPPKEVMFISRKFIGVYTFETVLDARTMAYEWLKDHER